MKPPVLFNTGLVPSCSDGTTSTSFVNSTAILFRPAVPLAPFSTSFTGAEKSLSVTETLAC
jgi:hypothetical protein